MLVTFLVFCICIFLVLTLLLVYLFKGTKNPTTVPSLEPREPKTGNFADIQDAGGLELFLDKLHSDLGPLAGFWYGETYMISVGKGSLLKPLSHLFDRPSQLFEMVRPIIGSGSIQFANASQGKTRWRAYTEAMSGKSVANKLPLILSIAKEMADAIGKMPTDDQALVQRLMLALAMKMLSRTQLGCYFQDDAKVAQFHQQYDSMNDEMTSILKGEKGAESRWNEDVKGMQQTIREALEAFKRDRESGDYEDAPLLSAVIDNTFDDEGSSDIGQELGDVIALVIGGYHTTGYGLTWVLYYLTMYPKVQEKVRDELRRVLGEDDLTSATLTKLIYTRQVVDETLRHTRLAGFAARTSNQIERVGGHLIPAGIPLLVSIHVICHDAEIFPDPDRFDPDRFAPEASKLRPALAFPIFGIGSRKCPGSNWAYAEIIAALTVLLRKFEVAPPVDGQPDMEVKQSHGFVTKPDRDVWVRFKPLETE